jgi:hypothetical protein
MPGKGLKNNAAGRSPAATSKLELFMNPSCLAYLQALFDCLGAPSISMAAGTNHVSLSCIPTRHLAPADLLGLFACLFGPNFFPESGLRSIQVFWSGPEGLAQIGPCRAESPEWGLSELNPGAYSPLFSIILEGEV